MKKLIAAGLIALAMPAAVFAGNDKIDPRGYLCAELTTESCMFEGEPPLFQALQIDGYVSADLKMPAADPNILPILLQQAFLWCQSRPEAKVMDMWREARATGPAPESQWDAEKSTCADYAANPEDASGFVIWLDGYNRKLNNTEKTILGSDKDVDAFVEACKGKPTHRMLDVLSEHAR